MGRTLRVPITGAVLRWAVEEGGFDSHDVARRVGVEAREFNAWEEGHAFPSKSEFSKLVDILRRPSAVFFLPEPPAPALPPRFRKAVGRRTVVLGPDALREIRWAQRLQRAIAALRSGRDEDTVDLPAFDVQAEPEVAGLSLRQWLGATVEQQHDWASPGIAFEGWRHHLQSQGVLVLQDRLGTRDVRGFSAWDPFAPLVAANTTGWTDQARIFTLFHELAHLSLRADAACTEAPRLTARRDSNEREERWCESTAAALLLPAAAVRALVPTRLDLEGAFRASRRLARKFHVSLRAAAIRLIELDLAATGLYSLVERRAPRGEHSLAGGGGKGQPRPALRLDQIGRGVARAFLDALREEQISERDARDYLRLGGTDLGELAQLVAAR